MATRERTYTGAELEARLRELGGWAAAGEAIRRIYTTDGWPTTLMLVNAIGFLAEAADHHPDLTVSWGKVVVQLNTHTAGGVTDKDLELARRIEALALWRPEAGGALAGTAKPWVQG
ncbi:MAG TPA: 4a-hydroxytetrahydrobiopterin dehydratase [Gemmatimonadales bacterium]|nr:4a-hydroxytetrahydrobiopterin dehydratase [Gemmatimonadales bacterium]